jgi:hypothetical protein
MRIMRRENYLIALMNNLGVVDSVAEPLLDFSFRIPWTSWSCAVPLCNALEWNLKVGARECVRTYLPTYLCTCCQWCPFVCAHTHT